mmetsp:Transcript_6776/g.24094  ORF Transcript_6776/g.24094 Transcript_6776/m.24094 type:complete len:188 (-) Transcript_6776:575-1138(-)
MADERRLLGDKSAAEDERRQLWLGVWACDEDGEALPPEFQPMPPEDMLFGEYAGPRFWAHALKDEWRESTILEVDAFLLKPYYIAPRVLLNVDDEDEDWVEKAEADMRLLFCCVRRKRCFIEETPWAKWCFSDRELLVEQLKEVARFFTGPYPALWPGITYARKAAARARKRDATRDAEGTESKKED